MRSTSFKSLRPRLPLLAVAMLVVPLAGCGTLSSRSVTGSGRVVAREFDLAGFSRVSAGSAFQVRLTQGDSGSISVAIDDNLVDYLDVSQSGDTLRLFLKPNVNFRQATLKATVVMPELTGLDLSGASRTTLAGFRSEKPLDVDLSGASDLRGQIQSGDAKFGLSGAAKVELRGRARHLRVSASGASAANLERYPSNDTVVKAEGASHVTVNASGKLEAGASGASSVRYVGTPAGVNIRVSGAATIRPK